jgi:uncharacterized protein (DUF885 family)
MNTFWIIFIILAAAVLGWLIYNLFWGKPFSIRFFFEWVFLKFALRNPEMLSMIGILEGFGLHFHNDDLTDISDKSQRSMNELIKKNLKTLRSYNCSRMKPATLLSVKIIDWFLDDQVRAQRWMYHDYPVNQMFGVQNDLPNFMMTIHRLNDRRGAKNYIKRLNKFGKKFDQLLEGLRIREGKGILPPRFVIRRVLEEMKSFIAAEPRQNPLFTTFKEKLSKTKLDETGIEALCQGVEQAIRDVVYPAYQHLIDYFTALESKATDEDGVWKLPDGEAYYTHCLRSLTSTELSPEQIHQTGLSEVERIEGEMRTILSRLGYSGKSIAALFQEFAREERFLYPNTDEGRSQALADYQSIINHIDQNLGHLFDRRPKSGVEVNRIPEFREKTSAGAYYMPPALDGSRPGVFFANLRDMNEVEKYGMQTLAYHEAIPGHHFQLALAQELRGVPTFRRLVPFTSYAEGWALYAEKLARENGFLSDPYSELGYLQSELFRAVRLVVDTGIHYKHWTRQQAIDYMVEHTGQAQASIVSEVERYIVMPGQACAYKIGELKIVELRRLAQQALGDRFDIKKFHNVILEHGSMPLEILEQQVKDFIAASGG